MTLLGGLVSIGAASCSDAPQSPKIKESMVVEDCPEPALADLYDKQGNLRDVRIIRYGSTNLYFPTQWIAKGLYADLPGAYDTTLAASAFDPPLKLRECPGIIHIPSGPGPETDWLPIIGIPFNESAAREQIHSSTVQAVFFVRNVSVKNDDRMQAMLSSGLHTGGFIASDDVRVFFWDLGQRPGEKRSTKDIEELFAWFASTPKKRDNEREFLLDTSSGE